MHYVKQFNINGVATKQVACIELHGKPNAATEGYVGVLGIDMDSPLHDVYKCVAVNGSIYTWDLLSSGLSIMSATISGGGTESVQFPYDNLRTPLTYVVKIGDLILDKEGYLYQINALNTTYCVATYCGTRVVAYGMSAYALAVEHGYKGSEEEWLADQKGDKGDQGIQGIPGLTPFIGSNGNWWIGDVDTGAPVLRMVTGSYTGGDSKYTKTLTFDISPKLVIIVPCNTGSVVSTPAVLIRPCTSIVCNQSHITPVEWGDTSVTLGENLSTSPDYIYDKRYVEYAYTAFGYADGAPESSGRDIVSVSIKEI